MLDKIRNPNPEILNKSEIRNEKNFKRKIKIYYRDAARLLKLVVPVFAVSKIPESL
jgi:hypothetical protein